MRFRRQETEASPTDLGSKACLSQTFWSQCLKGWTLEPCGGFTTCSWEVDFQSFPTHVEVPGKRAGTVAACVTAWIRGRPGRQRGCALFCPVDFHPPAASRGEAVNPECLQVTLLLNWPQGKGDAWGREAVILRGGLHAWQSFSGCSHILGWESTRVVMFRENLLPFGWGWLPGGPVIKNLPANERDVGRLRLDTCVGKIPWRRAWQTTPVFLPRESHGPRSLLGQGLWACKELNRTSQLNNFCTAKWFSYIYIHVHSFFIFFFIMVYYTILNIVLCAIQ